MIQRTDMGDLWRYEVVPAIVFHVSGLAHWTTGNFEGREWRPSIKVVLTVAHLNHVPEDCRPENLKHWCQRCHNTYDAPMRAKNRKGKQV